MQWLGQRSRFEALDAAVSFALLAGAWSGAAAAFCGWLLSGSGAYDGGILFWHRWLGVAVTMLAFIAWWLKRRPAGARTLNYSMLGLAAGLLLTGHLGGQLTHGSQYLLQYAPGIVRDLFGVEKSGAGPSGPVVADPDSVILYSALIQPLLDERCVACHGEEKSNGGLLLNNYEGLKKGGDHGAAVVEGDVRESELLRRLALPQTAAQFMPPKGEPLTFDQVRLIEWWIGSGADPEGSLSAAGLTAEIKTVLERGFGIIAEKRPFVETLEVPPAPAEALEGLRSEGWRVAPLAVGSNLLEISPPDTMAPGQVKQLLAAAEQIVWLDLSESGVTDDEVRTLAALPHLTRLRLEKNPLTDAAVGLLEELPHLESLNLYGTQVTDKALESIGRMPKLQRLYLWQTGVTAGAVEALCKDRPALEVDTGFQFAGNGE